MKAKTTALTFQRFIVEEALLEAVAPGPSKPLKNDSIARYELDIDFNHYVHEGLIKVDMVMGVNPKKKQPGFRVIVKTTGLFSLSACELSEQHLYNLQVISTTSIMINNVRNYISQLTAFSPFGMYLLPTIDINHLIEEKRKALDQSNTPE